MKRSLGIEDVASSDRLTGLASPASNVGVLKTPGKGTKFIVKPSLPMSVSTAGSDYDVTPAGSDGRLQFRTVLPLTSKLAANSASAAATSNTTGPPRKLITKDGRVISLRPAGGVKLAPSNTMTKGMVASPAAPRMILRAGTVRTPLATTPTTAAATNQRSVALVAPASAATNQKLAPSAGQIQVVRLADGTMRVNGLKQGQQILQLPGGQFQLVTASSSAASITPPAANTPVKSHTGDGVDRGSTGVTEDTATNTGSASKPASRNDQQVGSSDDQKSTQKMVTQVIDLEGMSRDELLNWQQKINDGSAKLALVNGKKVILNKVMLRQSAVGVSEDKTPVTLNTVSAPVCVPPVGTVPIAPAPPPAPAPTPVPAPAPVPSPAPTPTPVQPVVSGGRQREGGRRVTAMANVLQTAAGPRVVIQGVSTQGLSRPQLQQLQLQVKQQLAALSTSCTDPKQLSGVRQLQLFLPEPETRATAPAECSTEIDDQLKDELDLAHQMVTADTAREPQTEEREVLQECSDTQDSAAVQESTGDDSTREFTVTPEYIQQSISSALNSANLRPEIAQKLRKLRRKPVAAARPSSAMVPCAPLPYQDLTSLTNTRRRPRTTQDRTRDTERRSLQALQNQLQQRKEQLKREILRKRLAMEQQLQQEISEQQRRQEQEEEERKLLQQQREQILAGGRLKKKRRHSEDSVDCGDDTRKRHRHEVNSRQHVSASRSKLFSGSKKRQLEREEDGRQAPLSSAVPTANTRKLHCLCKQPFDPTKFYVGCDMCSNWYHGACVGITQRASKKMNSYTCPQCLQAKEQRQLFCLCRTEYDESQFYIGCDRCEDWFHGRCIGVLPLEGDTLDAYECPRCHPDAVLNRANMSTLSPADYSHLTKLLKHLQTNRNAAPFMKPVDSKQVPDYYRIIKHPMDLTTIARRVEERRYSRLCDFTGDVILMLDNCRFFNAAGSRLATAGTNLQAVFRSALVKLRQRVSAVNAR